MKHYCNRIGSEWSPPRGGEYHENRNPANPAEVLGLFPLSQDEDVDAAIDAAHAAFESWAATPGPERGRVLYRFADLLEEHAPGLAEILTKEQGKAYAESVGEVKRAAQEARFMAGEASRISGMNLPSEKSDQWVLHLREPIGVVAAITPWNFPVVAPVRKIAPAIAYGATVVFKPAMETPWTAVRIVELLIEAGLPDGVVNLVMGQGRSVGARLADSPRIAGITFTGSTAVGRGIYQSAAANLARVQLELGGKNAAVVIDPVDLEQAAKEIVAAAFTCSGQRCTAISRVIVHREWSESLTAAIVEQVEKIVVDDGLRPETTMGPLASRAQLEQVERYMRVAKDEAAEVLTGGSRLHEERAGYYYAPTVVTDVKKSSPLATEEIFGPVLPIIVCDTLEEIAEVSNATEYGLALSVFSRDIRTVMKLARQAKVGMVHINHGTSSQAHVPFGGVKSSGQGAFSIGATSKEFFTYEKVVYV